MNRRKITLQAIADRLGLSKFTVSQALSGKNRVSETTRRQVLAMAKAMGYRVRPAGQNESGEREGTAEKTEAGSPYVLVWALQAHHTETQFWAKVFSGISAGCEPYGWTPVMAALHARHETEIVFPAYLDKQQCAGMFIVGTFSTATIVSMMEWGLPLVLVDHEDSLVHVDCVVNANMDAGKRVCLKLIAAGAEKIAFVGDETFSVSFRERLWGCRLAMEEYRSKRHASVSGSAEVAFKYWHFPYPIGDKPNSAAGTAAERIGELLTRASRQSMPDAFICANDNIALLLIQQLNATEALVPGRCKVIGFDNIDAARYAAPALTTVELGKESLGYRAVEALYRRIRSPGAPAEKVTLSAELIVRDSG